MSYLNKAFLEISEYNLQKTLRYGSVFLYMNNYHFPHSILQFMMDILTVKIYVKIKRTVSMKQTSINPLLIVLEYNHCSNWAWNNLYMEFI